MPSKTNRRRRTRRRHHQKKTDSIVPPAENLNAEINFLVNNLQDTLDLQTNLDELVIDENCVDDEFYILGEGSYGLVTLGTLSKPDGHVIKVALKGANRTKFIKMMKTEAEIMANFNHVNVVKLLGVQNKPFKIIMEYMQHGDLLDALNNNVFPKIIDLIEVLIQVASGMEYISEMNYIHRDLACRNVFVNSKKQCKIGDFGLCQYVGNTGGILKVKKNELYNAYYAPEVMDTNEFTSKCDVWSMGLLVWELYISNELPSFFKIVLLDIFILTRELTKPRRCPQSLYWYIENLLLNEDPTKRPCFSEIKAFLCNLRRHLFVLSI